MSFVAAVIHYMVRMEKALGDSNIGFNLSHKQGSVMIEQMLPDLFYADDIVLFANSRDDRQRLVNISVVGMPSSILEQPLEQVKSVFGAVTPAFGAGTVFSQNIHRGTKFSLLLWGKHAKEICTESTEEFDRVLHQQIACSMKTPRSNTHARQP